MSEQVLQRLCENCGKPTGTEFYIVEDELGEQSVCHDCYELGKDTWLSARLHQEPEEELEALRDRIRSEFPEEWDQMKCVMCAEREVVAEPFEGFIVCAFCLSGEIKRDLKEQGHDFDEWVDIISKGTGEIPPGRVWRPWHEAEEPNGEDGDLWQLKLFGHEAVEWRAKGFEMIGQNCNERPAGAYTAGGIKTAPCDECFSGQYETRNILLVSESDREAIKRWPIDLPGLFGLGADRELAERIQAERKETRTARADDGLPF
jgi:hypothetical protein